MRSNKIKALSQANRGITLIIWFNPLQMADKRSKTIEDYSLQSTRPYRRKVD